MATALSLKKQPGDKKSKEDILENTFGCFISEKSADQISDEIHQSRHFVEKEMI